ncbi:MAG: PIG-L family deacetylase [Dehalococcoidia bacterium]|nr:PIG-L family deacetylase [Dehalococcoidia bacterium]
MTTRTIRAPRAPRATLRRRATVDVPALLQSTSNARELFDALQPKRAMAVFAHPDDCEFSSGGTIAVLTRLGWEVDIVVATSGNKGTKDPGVTPQQLAGEREEEQRAAARILGAREPVFFGFPDGGLVNDDELRGLVVRQLRIRRPELLITWDGFRTGFNHRDHRRVGRAAYDAVYPAADDHLYYPIDKEEDLVPHRPLVMLLAGATEPDLHVDIEPVLRTKVRATLAHVSQMGGRQEADMLRMWRERAAAAGDSVPRMRESFRRVVLRR